MTTPSASRRIARFCHLCGERLHGRFLVYNSTLVVCANCDTTSERCARCNVPVAASSSHEPVPLCPACQRDAPRCSNCSQRIISTWYTFEELVPTETPRQFCARCVQGRPRCDLCRAPVADGALPLSDGQFRCALCLSEIMLEDDAVASVYQEALDELAQVLGDALHETPQLQIVTRRQMGEIRRHYDHHDGESSSAASHHVLGYFVRTHGASTIYVETALPHGLLLGTLAHELAHGWQTEQSLHLKDSLLREGFAEWVAYRVLVARGLASLAERATRRDDVYGRGLRHFLNVESRFGYPGVVKRARGQAV